MDYDAARELARKSLGEGAPEEMARRAGVLFRRKDSNREEGSFLVPYLGEEYQVFFPAGAVEKVGGTGPVSPADQVPLLHYLATASGAPLSGKAISFKELWGGQIYIEPFNRRALNPMLKAFGTKSPELLEAARPLGGRKASQGDISVTVPVFPRVPVTLVFWEGDEEFPPSGTILFDNTANGYLPTEDLVYVTAACVYRLIKRNSFRSER
ncbi:MAG: DUF3786 domain-containing protein [Firmicutes bacterium]|nr:DUF3786 domain-containing protein [Bacillota bacterium]